MLFAEVSIFGFTLVGIFFFLIVSPVLYTGETATLCCCYPPFYVFKDHILPLELQAVGILCAILSLYLANFLFNNNCNGDTE